MINQDEKNNVDIMNIFKFYHKSECKDEIVERLKMWLLLLQNEKNNDILIRQY